MKKFVDKNRPQFYRHNWTKMNFKHTIYTRITKWKFKDIEIQFFAIKYLSFSDVKKDIILEIVNWFCKADTYELH